MADVLGKDVRFFMQHGDGSFYDISGMVVSYSLSAPYDKVAFADVDVAVTKIERSFDGTLSLRMLGDFVLDLPEYVDPDTVPENKDADAFWTCQFCGVVNSLDANICGEKHIHVAGCNSPRGRSID